MKMTEEYIQLHLQQSKFEETETSGTIYHSKKGWWDHVFGANMIFSHRDTYYTKESFDEGLHAHPYYELVLYVSGNVEYIRENARIKPAPYSVVWFLPGEMHTARLLRASRYERYVTYFSPDFFLSEDGSTAMPEFIDQSGLFSFALGNQAIAEINECLERIRYAIQMKNTYGRLLEKAYMTVFFDLLNTDDKERVSANIKDDTFFDVKRYIDREYSSIESIEQLAAQFFFSREHFSRKFKLQFNVSVSEYLSKRRVWESLALLKSKTVTEAAYEVGFRSQSSYIAAFVKHIGCLPSEYKKTTDSTVSNIKKGD